MNRTNILRSRIEYLEGRIRRNRELLKISGISWQEEERAEEQIQWDEEELEDLRKGQHHV